MVRRAAGSETIAAATRGQIVQRVLVDGWNAPQAAAVFGVRERDVVRWVAAYRRHGMASLRDELAAQRAPWRWLRRLVLAMRRAATQAEGAAPSAELAPFAPSRSPSARQSGR